MFILQDAFVGERLMGIKTSYLHGIRLGLLDNLGDLTGDPSRRSSIKDIAL